MAYILRFKVDGLAGRDTALSFELDRHRNVLFGPNGCGKTSLLRILFGALRNDAAGLALVPFTRATVTIHSVDDDRTYTRTIQRPTQPTPVEDRSIAVVSPSDPGASPSGAGKGAALSWTTSPAIPEASASVYAARYLPSSRLVMGGPRPGGAWFHDPSAQFTEAELDRVFAIDLQNRWRAYSTKFLRVINEAQERGLASVFKSVLRPAKPGHPGRAVASPGEEEAFSRMVAYLGRQNKAGLLPSKSAFLNRYRHNPLLRRVVRDITEIERNIEVASKPRDQVQALISQLFYGGKSVKFDDQRIAVRARGGELLDLATLSSGEKHILLLLVEALNSEQNPLLIDEPEISLHVSWQKRLLEAMSVLNSRNQVIVATHSPEIMADTPDENIFRIG